MPRYQKGHRYFDQEKLVAIAKWILAYQKEHGWAPSVREIADQFNTNSTAVARYWLDCMEENGMIERGPRGAARAIRVIWKDEEQNERQPETN